MTSSSIAPPRRLNGWARSAPFPIFLIGAMLLCTAAPARLLAVKPLPVTTIGSGGLAALSSAAKAPAPSLQGSRPPAGPQAKILCPARATDIWPGASIQKAVNGNPGPTTFCIRAGIHHLAGSITPKTGNIFVGEFGAILDGTGWMTTDDTQGAFRAHNQDIDDVIIRNLVIRRMPQRGVHAYPSGADRWTVENNEITANVVGVVMPNDSLVRSNYIHHNAGNPKSAAYVEQGGGYQLYQARNVIFDSNEIAYNSINQKIVSSTNVTFRNNFVHHNLDNGIWYDGDNTGSLIEGNLVEDNPGQGIFYEVSGQGIIRNNLVHRSGDNGILISTSKNVEIYNNTLADNFRGIHYLLNCDAAPLQGVIAYDLADDSSHDNSITVGSNAGAFANGFSYTGTCTSTQVEAHLNGEKNLTFFRNTYHVPSAAGLYWLWGAVTSWQQWQSLEQDVEGAVGR